MKNLLITILLALIAYVGYAQNQAFVLTSFSTENYTSEVDTTIVIVTDSTIFVHNKDFVFKDVILEFEVTTIEDLYPGEDYVKYDVVTDAALYSFQFLNKELVTIRSSNYFGDEFILQNTISQTQVDYSFVQTEEGWQMVRGVNISPTRAGLR